MFSFICKLLLLTLISSNLKCVKCLLDLHFEDIGSYTNELKHRKTYFFQRNIASWQEAQDICVEAGMEPLNLLTKLENTIFSVAVRASEHNLKGDSWHVGGKKQKDDWIWIQGDNASTKINFTMKWSSQENNPGKKCLAVNKNKEIGLIRFEAVNCDNQALGFFCQKTDKNAQSWSEKVFDSLEMSYWKVNKFFSGLGESLEFQSKYQKNNEIP